MLVGLSISILPQIKVAVRKMTDICRYLCYLAGERPCAGSFSLWVWYSTMLFWVKHSPCKIQMLRHKNQELGNFFLLFFNKKCHCHRCMATSNKDECRFKAYYSTILCEINDGAFSVEHINWTVLHAATNHSWQDVLAAWQESQVSDSWVNSFMA